MVLLNQSENTLRHSLGAVSQLPGGSQCRGKRMHGLWDQMHPEPRIPDLHLMSYDNIRKALI